MKYVSRALKYLQNYWPTALGSGIALLLVNLANLATPQLLKWLIDQGITPLNLTRVWQVAAMLVGVAVARGVFKFLQAYWSEMTSQGVAYDLRNALFEKLQKLSFSYHDRAQTGKLMTRMTSDVEMVRHFVGRGVVLLGSATLMLLSTLGIMFWMYWKLALLLFGLVPLILFIFAVFVGRIIPVSRAVQRKLANLNSILQENLAGMRVVKAFAREPYEIDRYLQQNKTLLDENLRLVHLFSVALPLVYLIANLGMVIVGWLGGLEVIRGALSLGDLVAFTGYIGLMLTPVFQMGMIGTMLSRAEASAERIFEVIDARSEVEEKPDAFPLPDLKGRVEFKDVIFRYSRGQEDILRNVSFTAEPGETVAILGQTGGGKSTIINLIPRFYDVTEGQVLIDGYDVRDVTLDSLRCQIGIVLQETTLFSGTIRENIAYGRPHAQMDEIIPAAQAAQAHDFIAALPDGYETPVGERGVGLSGGQKQRIAIARALLVNPRILILDDSTSSVDAETEYNIQQALEQLMEDRTSFVIAQRISTVRNADVILLLDDGQLVAKGQHDELLKTSELYVDILDTQFDKDVVGVGLAEQEEVMSI